ncbi:DUF6157 family protein [Paenibacillus sp. GD4]|uniref:DUF6157 family protein n=1 Tax=Paenibacillus sp. GD4 TaxID=3068890 RepID=UPI00279665DC|nr:DUF6157 family protein [Paenibacillus sp. GD4]MDQ1911011.1 DUF6157 family protein [Paenibacillus sp. GD4]
MEWNYYDTFITVAADCPAEFGMIPPARKSGLTIPGIEYALAADRPYRYTQEELLYQVYVRHKQIAESELSLRDAALREEFYGKPKPCMRASMLPKKYGWGIHFNREGKLALIPMESPEYASFVEGRVDGVKLVPAMRNTRKK